MNIYYPDFADTIPTDPVPLDAAPRIPRQRELSLCGVALLAAAAGSAVFVAYWIAMLAAWVVA